MSDLTTQTVIFTEPGPTNTDRTLAQVRSRAQALGIETILVATTTGATGLKAAQALQGFNVVAVTHSVGFHAPYHTEHDADLIEQIIAAGAKVLTTTHAFGGVGRAVRKKLGTYQTEEIIAYTLRCFGQGMKVAAEITLMAADAGYIVPAGDPIIAIGGSGRGADTAAVILPTHAQTFFDLKFLEVLCMAAPAHPARR
jgi:uncharacterized protein